MTREDLQRAMFRLGQLENPDREVDGVMGVMQQRDILRDAVKLLVPFAKECGHLWDCAQTRNMDMPCDCGWSDLITLWPEEENHV